jgi:hypothetical protein
MSYAPQTSFARHRRKYAPGDAVSLDDLREALQLAAELTMNNEVYLPIFLRLEAEVAAAEQQQSLKNRVRAAASGSYSCAAL